MLVLDSYTWEKKGWEAFVLPTTLGRTQSMKQVPRNAGPLCVGLHPNQPNHAGRHSWAAPEPQWTAQSLFGQHQRFHIQSFTLQTQHMEVFSEWCQIRGLQFPWVIHGDPTPHDGTLVHLSSKLWRDSSDCFTAVKRIAFPQGSCCPWRSFQWAIWS